MSKQVKMLVDKYPFGCKGDTVTLTDEEFKGLEKASKDADNEVYRVQVAADTTPVEDEPVKQEPENVKAEQHPKDAAKASAKPKVSESADKAEQSKPTDSAPAKSEEKKDEKPTADTTPTK